MYVCVRASMLCGRACVYIYVVPRLYICTHVCVLSAYSNFFELEIAGNDCLAADYVAC